MKVMSKFWTVIVSVVLLICAVVMTPMQMVGGTSWKSNGVKVSTGSKGEKIGDVEQFSELLQCFMNRSDNMSLQQDGGNYVLSASDLLSRAEEQLGYGDVEYSSWTTTVNLFASVDYEGVYVEMDGIMEIVVDEDKTAYHMSDIRISTNGVIINYDAEIYIDEDLAAIRYNVVSVAGSGSSVMDESLIDAILGKWVDLSDFGYMGTELVKICTSGMEEFFNMMDKGIHQALNEGSLKKDGKVYRTEYEGAELLIDLEDSREPYSEITFESPDGSQNIRYSIEFSGINDTEINFNSKAKVYNLNDLVEEED